MRWLPFVSCSNRSLPVDLDVFFAAAIGDRDHDAKADHDHDSDHSPRCADTLQNTQFPERGQQASNQDNKTNKIHTCPFHNQAPDKISYSKLQGTDKKAYLQAWPALLDAFGIAAITARQYGQNT
jgi:hypothetical protein